jgi:nucleoid-associated protein YgaU
MLLVVLVAGLVAVGCAKQLPQQVTDVNTALGQAKDACAGVYAADDLQQVQGRVDAMNDLADEKKYKKARKAAEPLLPEVDGLKSAAASAKAEAKSEAESAVKAAQSKLAAADSAQAASLAGGTYGQAKSKLDSARTSLSDPCKYGEATALAQEAGKTADMAREQAVAEKRRREEEARRKAEEERRRREEEARRAEEERLKNFPPEYTVEPGDSLWRIAGMDRIYRSPVYWPLLYDANRDQIDHPDLIYPGAVLTIPRGMSPEEMDERLHQLWREMGGELALED